MGKRFLLVSLMLVVTSQVWADDDEIGKQLTAKYANQIFVLRHAIQSNPQRYSASGDPVNGAAEGPWTLFGRIAFQQIVLSRKELRVEGKRVFYQVDPEAKRMPPLDPQARRLAPHISGEAVKIAIAIETPITDPSQAESLLGNVFARTPDEILTAAPAYWRNYLARELAISANATGAGENKTDEKISEANPQELPPEDKDNAKKIFHLGEGGITPPKPQFTPEPAFTEIARKQGYQGVMALEIIVDKTGHVSDVRIQSPVGMGLDDNAVSTVKTWRFVPAKVKGEPAACAFHVEVDFHLYDRIVR